MKSFHFGRILHQRRSFSSAVKGLRQLIAQPCAVLEIRLRKILWLHDPMFFSFWIVVSLPSCVGGLCFDFNLEMIYWRYKSEYISSLKTEFKGFKINIWNREGTYILATTFRLSFWRFRWCVVQVRLWMFGEFYFSDISLV